MAFEIMVKSLLLGESEKEVEQDLEYYLKTNPTYCVRCGVQLTANDVLGSQGHHCQKCWAELQKEIKDYLLREKGLDIFDDLEGDA